MGPKDRERRHNVLALSRRTKPTSEMEVNEIMKLAIAAKKVVILIMAIGLAVALVACQAAAPTPKDPEPGPPGEPGKPAPQRPYIDDEFVDVELATSGEMAMRTISLAGHFVDPDGKESDPPLKYAAKSSNSEVVTAEVSGSTLTLTAVAEGRARITVRATDKDGQSSSGAEPGARFYVDVMPTVAPVVAEGGIPPQTLYLPEDPQTIVLTSSEDAEGYFSHDKSITYDISVSPEGFVLAVEEPEGSLKLTPRVAGSTIVTITAMADSKSTDPVEFTVTVMARSKPVGPEATGEINPMTLMVGGDPGSVDVADNFSDPDEQMLTFTAMSSDEGAATTMVSGSTVTVTAVAEGMATITVTATDEDGKTAELTFEVTVEAAAPGDGDDPGDDPGDDDGPMGLQKVGTIGPRTLMVDGEPVTVNVAGNFSSDNMLEYEASSSDDMIATADADGSMVTVTAVAEGTAIITVTATEEGEEGQSVDQTFMVTVSEPESMWPSEIAGKGKETEEFELEPGQYVVSSDNLIVERKKVSDTKWKLVGKKRGGPVTITIMNADGTEHDDFEVTVSNSPPALSTTIPAAIYDPVQNTGDDFYTVKADGADAAAAALDISTFFMDPDEDAGDELKYIVVRNSSPSHVKPTVKGTSIQLDVIVKEGAYFTLGVLAEDDEGERSESVTLTIATIDALSATHVVTQKRDGSFEPVKINNRQNSAKDNGADTPVLNRTHTLNFKPLGGGSDGFRFAEQFLAKLKLDHEENGGIAAVDHLAEREVGAPPVVTNHEYTVTATGPIDNVVVEGEADASADEYATVMFRLYGNASPTISIVYHVWVTVPTEEDASNLVKMSSKPQKLTMTVDR